MTMKSLMKLFNMGRPKKIVAETVEAQIVEEVKTVSDGTCHHCKRPGTEFRCFKGDSNQYKFCSIECFYADKTV